MSKVFANAKFRVFYLFFLYKYCNKIFYCFQEKLTRKRFFDIIYVNKREVRVKMNTVVCKVEKCPYRSKSGFCRNKLTYINVNGACGHIYNDRG